DVVRDRVGPRAAQADLAAVAGLDAVGRSELTAEGRAEALQHRQCRLVSGAEADRSLGRTRARVLLQQAVSVLAPARALADELDLAVALPHPHRLDRRGHRRDAGAGHLAERRALVAEDARVAVLVGADPAGNPHVREHAREDPHRVLDTRVLG